MEHLIPFFCHRALMADKLCLARFPLGPIVLIQEQDHVTTHFACNAYVHRMNGSCRTSFSPVRSKAQRVPPWQASFRGTHVPPADGKPLFAELTSLLPMASLSKNWAAAFCLDPRAKAFSRIPAFYDFFIACCVDMMQ